MDNQLSLVESLYLGIAGMLTVFAVLVALALIVILISKAIRSFEDNKTQKQVPLQSVTVVEKNKEPANILQGEVKLENVAEKDAAVIMAIISDETKIKLNELRFKHIKLT